MPQEQTIIVDENDQVIWHKARIELGKNDIYRASVIVIKNSYWEYLMAQRSKTKDKNPCSWSFSAGWTHALWEDYDSNIVKELEEEIWLVDLEIQKLHKTKRSGSYSYFCQYYICYADINIDNLILQKEEVEDVAWLSVEEIQKWNYKGNLISSHFLENLEQFEQVI
jgi:8-oxo-dGTP pyrophosphatase MutT (NUDIX family)